MTTFNDQPDWQAPAPAEAVRVVLNAVARSGAGDADGCCAVLTVSGVDDRWLRIVAVDLLAGFVRPHPELWTELRHQLHDRAVACGAPDTQLRASLHVVALAEARDRRADLKVAELEHLCEFSHADVACVAAGLAGQVGACLLGPDGLTAHLRSAANLFGTA